MPIISRATILEIFANPKDLDMKIGQENGENYFFLTICRGPSGRFKPLLAGTLSFDSLEEVINEIKKILEYICNEGLRIVCNCNFGCLDQSLIDRIVQQLRENGVASTYEMPTSK